MKKLAMVLGLIAVMFANSSVSLACESVPTNGKALFTTLGNATITVDGEKVTLPNSFIANAYTEFQKRTYISENYDAVSFYLQMSPDAPEDNQEDLVRLIFNRLKGEGVNPDDAGSRFAQTQAAYYLKKGEDAIHITLPFKYIDQSTGNEEYYNNFYAILTDGSTADKRINIIISDLQFIKYVAQAPTAKVADADVVSVGEELRSRVTVEFSQKMNPATATTEDFTVNGEKVSSVKFDETGKKVYLTCPELLEFDKDYELTISENVENLCDDCRFSVDEASRNLTVRFDTPLPIKVGKGRFTDENGQTITNITEGKNIYTVPVQNVYDLTEGGKHFTLITAMYLNNVLSRIYYDECTLLPGESADLSRTVSVNSKNVMNTEIQAFLWDNAVDMNAFADMNELKPFTADY